MEKSKTNMLIKNTSKKILIMGVAGLTAYSMSFIVSAQSHKAQFIRHRIREVSENDGFSSNATTGNFETKNSTLFENSQEYHHLTTQDIADQLKKNKEQQGAPKPVTPKPHTPSKIEVSMKRGFTKEKNTLIKPLFNKKAP